jgi:hypothetical protein
MTGVLVSAVAPPVHSAGIGPGAAVAVRVSVAFCEPSVTGKNAVSNKQTNPIGMDRSARVLMRRINRHQQP